MFAGHHLCAKGACGTTDYEQHNYNLRVKRAGGAFFRTGSCVGNKRIAVGFFFNSAISALQLLKKSKPSRTASHRCQVLAITRQFEIIVCTISYILVWKLRFCNTANIPPGFIMSNWLTKGPHITAYCCKNLYMLYALGNRHCMMGKTRRTFLSSD